MVKVIIFLLEILMLVSLFNFNPNTVWEALLLGAMSLLIVILVTNIIRNE